MLKKTIILLLLILPAVFSAAQAADWYVGKEIVDIRFEGLQSVSPTELEGITDQFIGKAFSETLYWDLQSKLFALNYFEQFVPEALPGDPDNTTVVIKFMVTERPLVSEIVITGNKNLRTLDILNVVLTKPDDLVNRAKIRLDAEAIKNLYIDEGYPDATVNGTFEENEEENTATVVFNIEEGMQTRVKAIGFSGNSFASGSTLKRKISTKEQSIFSSGIFQESKLQEDIRSILDYYNENGYIDAQILDVQREMVEEEGKNYLNLTFYLEEGEQYTYGGVSFQGNTLFSNEFLLSKTTLTPGSILNKTKLEIDFRRISDLYYNDGYIFNVINRKEIRDEEANEVSYVIEITEQGRAHIENIIIKGNTKTKDHVILRELPIQLGDIFSQSKILTGIYNLMNLQFFSQVIPETPYGSAPGLMDLVINVEEGRTTDIGFGISFTGTAGTFPVLGFLNWTDSNFRGLGQELQIGTEISSDSQSLIFSFTENWLFGKRLSSGLKFEIEHDKTTAASQDILFPIFSGYESNAVPDPFDGHFVDPDTGQPATETQISDGTAITDYQYAVKQGYSIPSEYKMDYDSFNFTLSGSGGFSKHSYLGRLGTGMGMSSSLNYLYYDAGVHRPFDPVVRESLNQWLFVNKWWGNLSWDSRLTDPNNGYLLRQNITYSGGFLGGVRDYIRSTTTGELFFQLFEATLGESWTLKPVVALHTSFSAILPQYYKTEDGWVWDTRTTTDDLLYTDWMITAKGWPSMYDGEALWDNWIELRVPLAENYFSWTNFFSCTGFWNDRNDLTSMALEDFYFSFGSGIQLTIPNFPMGFYLVKRFKYDENNVFQWQSGDLFRNEERPTSGIDFVLSFTLNYF